MNHIKDIATMLGVRIGVPFAIASKYNETRYIMKFTNTKLLICLDGIWSECYGLQWGALMNGTLEVDSAYRSK